MHEDALEPEAATLPGPMNHANDLQQKNLFQAIAFSGSASVSLARQTSHREAWLTDEANMRVHVYKPHTSDFLHCFLASGLIRC